MDGLLELSACAGESQVKNGRLQHSAGARLASNIASPYAVSRSRSRMDIHCRGIRACLFASALVVCPYLVGQNSAVSFTSSQAAVTDPLQYIGNHEPWPDSSIKIGSWTSSMAVPIILAGLPPNTVISMATAFGTYGARAAPRLT